MTTTSSVPVLFLVFNRPETTRRVLQAIRMAAPARLFVAADGPRAGVPSDAARCAEVQRLIQEGIDWDCEVKYLRRNANLGCKIAVSSAISWFFDAEQEGIILEDDCLPSQQFFLFCATLLERYRHEPRVTHIGGFNCQRGVKRGTASYYFSRYFHVWGWATWKRAWAQYDVEMRDYPRFLAEGGLENLFERRSVQGFWQNIFDATASGAIDTWDYQWVFRNFKEDRLAAVPNVSLVENIGFGLDATHTSASRAPYAARAGESSWEIKHPSFILPCREADDFTYRKHLGLGKFHDLKQFVKRVVWSLFSGAACRSF